MADDDDAAAIIAVYEIARLALEAVDTDKTKQELEVNTRGYRFYRVHAQMVVNFLQQHPNAVNRLCLTFHSLSVGAMEILRVYFTTATLGTITLCGPIGIANGPHLLSGLYHNTSVTRLTLQNVGFEGVECGSVIASLLRHNSILSDLRLFQVALGPAGAQALQESLRENQVIDKLWLDGCRLGDNGVSAIVNALEGNAMKALSFQQNNITSNALPVMTQWLQNVSSPVLCLGLGNNPGLFDNDENTGNFFSVLAGHEKQLLLEVDRCRLPGRTLFALFQMAATTNTALHLLNVYESDQLQGQDLDRLLEVIPQLQLSQLHFNLEVARQSVVSAFHRNSSIQHLYVTHDVFEEISAGPVFGSLNRNRRLDLANDLIMGEKEILRDLNDYENGTRSDHDSALSDLASNGNRRHIPLGTFVWSKGMERLGRDAIGATAIYQIMCDRLPVWSDAWKSARTNTTINAAGPPLPAPPVPVAAGVDGLPPAPPAAAAAAAAAAAPSASMSSGTTEEDTQETTSRRRAAKKRPRSHHDDEETTATNVEQQQGRKKPPHS